MRFRCATMCAAVRLTSCYANVSDARHYLVAVPKENPPPVLVAPRVPVPKLKPDIFIWTTARTPHSNLLSYLADSTLDQSIGITAKLIVSIKDVGQIFGIFSPQNIVQYAVFNWILHGRPLAFR